MHRPIFAFASFVLLLACSCRRNVSTSSSSPADAAIVEHAAFDGGSRITDSALGAVAREADIEAGAGPVCVPGRGPSLVTVSFTTDYEGFKAEDGTRYPGFNARVRMPALHVVLNVFGEAKDNCKSCRSHVEGRKLLFSCHGDMSIREGTVSYDDNAIITEWRETLMDGTPYQVSVPERDVRPIRCGARILFRSTVPDDRRVPHRCE